MSAVNIGFPFIGDTIGGSHISTLLLIKHLDRSKYNPHIILHEKGPLSHYLDTNHIPYTVITLPFGYVGSHGIFHQLRAAIHARFLLSRLLRIRHFKCIHTNDMRCHLSWGAGLFRNPIKHIWHQRTTFPDSKLARFFIGRAAKVITISDFITNSLPTLIKSHATRVYNPVEPSKDIDTSLYKQKILAKTPFDDAYIVGIFGNLRAVKQPMAAVDALVKANPDLDKPLVLTVFGEDREHWIPQMKQLAAQSKLQDHLTFQGFKAPIEPWMAACDVVLATSLSDGFGRTIIEAQSVNVPVIATDAGGHKELIQQGKDGFLVAINDSATYADRIVKLCTQQELTRRITEEASKGLARFDPDKHAKAVETIYDSLV